MAHEMKMPLARLNVSIGVAKLERITKTDPEMAPLVIAARQCVERARTAISLDASATACSEAVA
jgi:hypothetical protein